MEITPKSTKNEILAAYEEMLKKVQEMKSDAPKQQQAEQKIIGIKWSLFLSRCEILLST